MDFGLFILLNALLLLRPEDLFPAISGLRLYLVTIVLCTAVSSPKLSYILSQQILAGRPVAVCVLGMLLASFVSAALRDRIDLATDLFGEFAKVALYFFLLIAVVDTPERLRAFLGWVVVFVCLSSGIALIQYYGYYEFQGIDIVSQNDDFGGDGEKVRRIASAGLFNDPNDFCVMLMTAVMICVGLVVTSSGLVRVLWLLALGPLFYTGTLTHSRGGILALLAGVAATIFAFVGFKRSLPLTVLAFPVVLMAGSSRGSSIGGGGTAHDRLMLWAYNFNDLFRAPLYIPTGLGPNYSAEEHGLVCHNSYVSAYVELGLLGGGAFIGMFYFTLRMLHSAGHSEPPDWARRLRPFVFGAVACYAGGCYSLSRNFVLSVYLVVGIGSAFAAIVTPETPERYRVTIHWWRFMLIASIFGLVAMKFSTQILGQMGV